ncbi:MAG TPA: hypothetical protein VF192_05235 [Longimicrobiales bacterium]
MRCDGTRVSRATVVLAAITLAWHPDTAAAQAPAAQPFAGYNPGRCAVAARMIDAINRHDRRDTTIYTPRRDTLFTATVESLRECERSYGGTAPHPAEVLNVARVQLLTGQDEAAAATQRQHMASIAGRPAEERAWELYLIIIDNLAGKPARLERARAALAELDALGKAAAGLRVLAHAAMMDEAIERYDDDAMRREAAAALEAWLELDEESRVWRADVLTNVFLRRAAVEMLAQGGDAALAIVDSARGIVPVQARTARMRIDRARRLISGNMGRTAAPLDAQFWYNTGATGTHRPAPGRVSLILPAYRPCIGVCLPMMDAARRIEARFRGQGLDITFRTRTYGFYADTAPAAPLAEAQYDSAYFLHHVGLPGALAIAETKFGFRPDGRRVNEPTTDDLNYPGASIVVVDRNGIIRYVAAVWDPVLEARVTELIGRLLQEETADGTDGDPPGAAARAGPERRQPPPGTGHDHERPPALRASGTPRSRPG